MPILLLLTAFLSGIIFYSEKALAAEPQTMEEIEAKERSFMYSLNQVFQADRDTIAQHDEALQSALSGLQDCPYSDRITDRIKDVFMFDCKELIDKARGDQDISYFLLEKALERNGKTPAFKEPSSILANEERNQALKGLLQDTKDIVLSCQCKSNEGDISFTLKHKYNTTEEEKSQDLTEIFLEKKCTRDHINDSSSWVSFMGCSPHESIEQEEREAIAYVQSQLESCTYENTGSNESDSFSCTALIETAKNEGLSYFQMRYAIQESVEKLESRLSSAEEAVQTDKQQQAKQQKKKP